LPFPEALILEKGLLLRENIQICEVTPDHYLNAVSILEQHLVGMNDALAYVLMKKTAITKIYSFDRHFDCFPEIKRITE
jgi:predicted nucleic acid-binding protein